MLDYANKESLYFMGIIKYKGSRTDEVNIIMKKSRKKSVR